MKQVKVSLIGSEGYIGKKMYAHLKTEYDVTCIDLCTDIALDLKQPECFDYEVIENNYVIVMAAISSPDVCAKKYEEAYSINVKGTSYFIREAIKHGCRVLFFSSDAVFGFQNEIVNELTETREDTAYGMMKKKIEDEFKDNPCFKAIRLSYVFSKTDRYTSYLLKCINEGKTAEVFHPFYRNVVTADDVITVVQWLINNSAVFGGKTGVYD